MELHISTTCLRICEPCFSRSSPSFSLRAVVLPPPPTVRSTLIRRPSIGDRWRRRAVWTSLSLESSTKAVPRERPPSECVRRRTLSPPATPPCRKCFWMSAAVAEYGSWPTKSVHEMRSGIGREPREEEEAPPPSAAASSSSSHSVRRAAAAAAPPLLPSSSAGASSSALPLLLFSRFRFFLGSPSAGFFAGCDSAPCPRRSGAGPGGGCPLATASRRARRAALDGMLLLCADVVVCGACVLAGRPARRTVARLCVGGALGCVS